MCNFTWVVRNGRLKELGEKTHPKVNLQTHRKVIPSAKAIDHGKERRWGNEKPHFKHVAANKLPAHCSIVFTITAELRTKKKTPDICVQSSEFMLLAEGYVLSLNSLLKKNIPHAAFPQVILLPSCVLSANKTICCHSITNTQEFLLAASNGKEV